MRPKEGGRGDAKDCTCGRLRACADSFQGVADDVGAVVRFALQLRPGQSGTAAFCLSGRGTTPLWVAADAIAKASADLKSISERVVQGVSVLH